MSSSTGKGLGVFALKDFKAGDLIFAEESLLPVAPNNSWLTKEAAFALATPERQKQFMALHSQCNCGKQDCQETEFMRRYDANSFETSMPVGTSNLVFDVFSRINHACTPNSMHKFISEGKGALARIAVIKAAKPIKNGEELTIDYIGCCNGLVPKQVRRNILLEKYKFFCRCKGCTGYSPQDKIGGGISQNQQDPETTRLLGENFFGSIETKLPANFAVLNAHGRLELKAERKLSLWMNTMLDVLTSMKEIIMVNIANDLKNSGIDETTPKMGAEVYGRVVKITFNAWETTLQQCNVFKLDQDVLTKYIQRLKRKVADTFELKFLIRAGIVDSVQLILAMFGSTFRM